jgi:hypothetical protein
MGLERKILVMLTKRKCFLVNNVFVKKIRVVMLNCMICIDCVFYYNTRLNSSMYWFSGECDFFFFSSWNLLLSYALLSMCSLVILWHAYVQVPSEGNLSTEKRKAEDDIESAEKRKRKKNKCPTPRPACSWVHFRYNHSFTRISYVST